MTPILRRNCILILTQSILLQLVLLLIEILDYNDITVTSNTSIYELLSLGTVSMSPLANSTPTIDSYILLLSDIMS